MFQSLNLKETGGLLLFQDTLDYMQSSYSSVLDAIAESFGDLVIVSGLVQTGNNVTAGWLVYNKGIYPIAASQVQQYLYEVIDDQQEGFEDGSTKTVYIKRSLAFTSVNTGIAWTDVKRLPFATTSLLDAFNTVQFLFGKLMFDEPVILSGCTTSNLNVAASKVTIAAGIVYMGGKMISTPDYQNNIYPAFLNSNGAWTNTQPSGVFIKFDHETSQRYADVIRRNTSHTGQVFTHTNPDELQYFDTATGIGKWRWLGFKISDNLQSRVPIGYDIRTSNPGGADSNAWDSANRIIGNPLGENKHQLTLGEMPKHKFNTVVGGSRGAEKITNDTNASVAAGGDSSEDSSDWNYQLTKGTGAANYGKTNELGNDEVHNIRQPSRIVLQIERM